MVRGTVVLLEAYRTNLSMLITKGAEGINANSLYVQGKREQLAKPVARSVTQRRRSLHSRVIT